MPDKSDMKAVLVCPATTFPRSSASPPLGLLYLASVFEQHDYETRVFDLGTADPGNCDFWEVLARDRPQVVGLSCITPNLSRCIDLSWAIKRKLPDSHVLVGGPHPSARPQDLTRHSGADAVVMGEAEDAVRGYLCSCDLHTLKNAWVRRGGRWQRTKIAGNPELHHLPLPSRHLLNQEYYSLQHESGRFMHLVLTQRGCPYHCTFCSRGAAGNRVRYRFASDVANEVALLREQYGETSFYLCDQCTTSRRQLLSDICSAIRYYNMPWHCLGRVDHVDQKLVQGLVQAGCTQINLGIESGSEDILHELGKGFNIRTVRQAIQICKDAGLRVKGYFMVGSPGESRRSFNETLVLAESLALDVYQFSMFTPYPGTAVWKRLGMDAVVNRDWTVCDCLYSYASPGESKSMGVNCSQVSDSELSVMYSEAKELEKRLSAFP